MAAGTVISGGFPGRIAQEVQPNPKCNGCLHFDGQAGRIGACAIGLKPWLCGEGDAADIGYAPIARGAGKYLPDMNTHGAHAPEVGDQDTSSMYGAGSTRPITFQQVSLGEEHVHFAKSLIARHDTLQKSMCRLCKSTGMIGTAPANIGPQVCTCETITANDVAKALASRLSNLEASVVSMNDLTAFVYACAKSNFNPSIVKGTFYHAHGKYEVSAAGNGSGEHHVDFHPKGGGKPTRVATVGSRGTARSAAETHARRFASGTGAENAGGHKPKSTHTPHGMPSMKEAVSVAKKALSWKHEGKIMHTGETAKHGHYQVEQSGSRHALLYSPRSGSNRSQRLLGYHPDQGAARTAAHAHHGKKVEKSFGIEKAEGHSFKPGQLVVHNASGDAQAHGTIGAVGRRSTGTHVHFKTASGAPRMIHHEELRAASPADKQRHASTIHKLHGLGHTDEPVGKSLDEIVEIIEAITKGDGIQPPGQRPSGSGVGAAVMQAPAKVFETRSSPDLGTKGRGTIPAKTENTTPRISPAAPAAPKPPSVGKSLDEIVTELHEEEDVEKSLRWSHKAPGQAKTSHGSYTVAAHPEGGHTVTYTNKETGKSHAKTFASHREALGAVTEHHLKNRPPPKKREKKPKAVEPKQLTARAGAPAHCPPCS